MEKGVKTSDSEKESLHHFEEEYAFMQERKDIAITG